MGTELVSKRGEVTLLLKLECAIPANMGRIRPNLDGIALNWLESQQRQTKGAHHGTGPGALYITLTHEYTSTVSACHITRRDKQLWSKGRQSVVRPRLRCTEGFTLRI